MPKYKLGMNAKAYWGPETGTGVPASEMRNVKDLTINSQADVADITTRDNEGYYAEVQTLKRLSVDWNMLWLEDEPAFSAILDAHLNATPLRFAFLTGENGSGPVGLFSITNFTRNEQLAEGITVDVTASLIKLDQYKKTT